MNENKFVESGFAFSTKEEAETAKKEINKVKIVKQKIDVNNPEMSLKIYNKLIEENVFTTPVGYTFLNDFREYLLGQPSVDNETVLPITISKQVVVKEVFEKGQVKRSPLNNGKKTDYKKKANFLTKICIILSAVIVAMFIINMTSDNVNIINYRNEIINQYEDWEKELTEREEAVKILEDKYKK